jgi:hypothetical protein
MLPFCQPFDEFSMNSCSRLRFLGPSPHVDFAPLIEKSKGVFLWGHDPQKHPNEDLWVFRLKNGLDAIALLRFRPIDLGAIIGLKSPE